MNEQLETDGFPAIFEKFNAAFGLTAVERAVMTSTILHYQSAIEDLKAKNEKVYGWLDQANYKKNEYLARAEKAETDLFEKTARVERLREAIENMLIASQSFNQQDWVDATDSLREAFSATEPNVDN